jgi:hypothetical protein
VAAAGAAYTAFVVVEWEAGQTYRERFGLGRLEFHATLGFEPADLHGVAKGRAAVVATMEELGLGPDGQPLPEEAVARQYEAFVAWAEEQRVAERQSHSSPSRSWSRSRSRNRSRSSSGSESSGSRRERKRRRKDAKRAKKEKKRARKARRRGNEEVAGQDGSLPYDPLDPTTEDVPSFGGIRRD